MTPEDRLPEDATRAEDLTRAELAAEGLAVRRAVLSDAHVDAALAATTPFTAPFQDLITRYAWGEIWSRPGLDRRLRSAVALTALVAGGHWDELALHLRAAVRNGLSHEEIREILLQTAVYCSVPSANHAFAIAAEVLADHGPAEEPEQGEEPIPVIDCFVYEAVRTPFGRIGGALAGVRPDDLAALVVSELVGRAPDLDLARVDEVVLGNANGAGEENRNVARMASLLAGLPTSVPGTTVNRLCGSSLDAAMIASRQIAVGEADVIVVGGVESMSRAPWVVPKPDRAFPAGDTTLVSTTLGWRLVNPDMPEIWTVSLGEATEQLRQRFGITRERQDAFALRSHVLAARAWESGFYDDLVMPVPGVELVRDESIRATSPEKLAGLQPVFREAADGPEGGTVTAGNASPLTDGASAVLLGSAGAAELTGLPPLARIAGRGAAALEPQLFGFAPVQAAERALARAGIGWDDVGAVELNEAFAAQSLACVDAWRIDPDLVNRRGGALALGHPLGASGTRLIGTLARELQRSGERWGVAAICIGVGQGLAVVLENDTPGRAAPGPGTAA